MRELTKKALAAGLINKHAVKQVQMWNGNMDLLAGVPEEDLDRIHQAEGNLTELMDDMEQLLEQELPELPELREQDLDLPLKVNGKQFVFVARVDGSGMTRGVWLETGELAVAVGDVNKELLEAGVDLYCRPGRENGREFGYYKLVDVERRFAGPTPTYYIIKVEGTNAEMRTVP